MKLGINEELWYGDDTGEEAEKRAAKSMAARMGRIIGTKPFPIAAQRLTVLTQNPDCSMDEVVIVLESDPALSSRLLRLVNSAGFALRTACTSVRHAATLVGTEKLNQVASTAAILDMYGKSGEHAAVILEHATSVGSLCRYLAFHFSLPPDELFTCGFLHDIGKLMLMETEGEEYLDLIKRHDDFDTAYIEERARYGFDHALLAGHVLAAWNIPHPVPKVVAWHHHITRAYAESTQIAQMVSTLRLADAMSFAFLQPDPKLEIERLARMEAASYMDISEAQLAAMWDEVKALTERARAIFRGEDPPDLPVLPEVIQTGRPSQQSLRAVASGRQSLKALPELATSVRPPPVSASLRAPSPRAVEISEPQTPRQFPCVVCEGPSFAQTCAACHGYVCPRHIDGADEWCELCQDAYREAGIPHVSPGMSVVLGAGLGILVAAAFFGAASAGAQQPLRLMFGPTLVMMLLGMLVGISQRWVRRWWFLRSRPNRSLDHRKTIEELLSSAQQLPRAVAIRELEGASPETERLGQHNGDQPTSSAADQHHARALQIEREPDLSPRATRSAELRSGSLPPPPARSRASAATRASAAQRSSQLDSPMPKIPAAPALPGPDILPPVMSVPPPPSNRNKLWMSKSPLTPSPSNMGQGDAGHDDASTESARDSRPADAPEPNQESHRSLQGTDSYRDAAVPVARASALEPAPAIASNTLVEQATPITLPSQPPGPPSDAEPPATRLDGRRSAPPPASQRVFSRTINGIPAPVPISQPHADANDPMALSPDGTLNSPESHWSHVLDDQGTADGW